MNFKASIKIIFSFVVFSCFADQEVFYNPQGLLTITELAFFKDADSKNMKDQLYFIEGLNNFCKEKGIKEGDVIGLIANNHDLTNFSAQKRLLLSNPHFSTRILIINNVDEVIRVGGAFLLKRSVAITPAMAEFINAMIKKGKSVNQNS